MYFNSIILLSDAVTDFSFYIIIYIKYIQPVHGAIKTCVYSSLIVCDQAIQVFMAKPHN